MNQSEYADSSESVYSEDANSFNEENEQNPIEGDAYGSRTVSEEYKESIHYIESEEITNVSKNLMNSETPYEEIVNITINEKYTEENNVSQNRNRFNDFITNSEEEEEEEEETYSINVNSILNSTIHKILGKKSDILNEILGKRTKERKERQENRPQRNQNASNRPTQVPINTNDNTFNRWNDNESVQPPTAFSIRSSVRVNTTTPTNPSNRKPSIIQTHHVSHENNTTSVLPPTSHGIRRNIRRNRQQEFQDEEAGSDGSSSSSSDVGRPNGSERTNHTHPLSNAHNSRNDRLEHGQCENEINEMLKERIYHFLNKVKSHVESYKGTTVDFMKFIERMQKTLWNAIREMAMIYDVSRPILKIEDSSGIDVIDIIYYNNVDENSSHNSLTNFMTTQNAKHIERMHDQNHYDKLFLQTMKELVSSMNEVFTNRKKLERISEQLDEDSIREYIKYFSKKLSKYKNYFENIVNEYINAYDKAAETFNRQFVLSVGLFINSSFKDILSSMIYDKKTSSYMIKTPLGKVPSLYQFIKHISLFLEGIFDFFDNFIQNLQTFTNAHLDEVVGYIDSFSYFYEQRYSLAHITNDSNLFFKKTNQNNHDFMWKNKQNDHMLLNHILHYSSSCSEDVQLKDQHNKKKSKQKNERMGNGQDPSIHNSRNPTNENLEEHVEYEKIKLPMNLIEEEESFDIQELKFLNEPQNIQDTHFFGGSEKKRKAAPKYKNKTLNNYYKDTESKKPDVLKESSTYDLLENFKSKLNSVPSSSYSIYSENKEAPIKKKIRISSNNPPQTNHEYKDYLGKTSASNVNHNKHNDSFPYFSRNVPSKNQSNQVFSYNSVMDPQQERVLTQTHATTNPVPKTQSVRTRKLYPNKKYNRLNGNSSVQTTNQNNSSLTKNGNNENNKGNSISLHDSTSYARSSHPTTTMRNQDQATKTNEEYFVNPDFDI